MSFVGKALNSVVGGITGANSAADAQINAANQSNATSWNIYQDQKNTNAPFLKAGLQGLSGLQGIAGNPINRGQLLTEYFNSPEYRMLADQARYQALNSAEATGGLGSTATGNNLAAIAPQLGQNYLGMMTDQQNNMYGQLLGLSNVGLSAAGANNAAAGNYSNAYTNNMQQIGASQAGKAQSGWNSLMQIGGVASGFF
ncbi:DNA transfer protein [Morganella morganii]|uniref:DNA transfer protein n=1 Tax=Morganella morganii TaxID=582 RepID=UPI000BBD344A|nr:DNA transfer protein [Morganella morganii]ATF52945.1 DNA transfer protein [Morganella morganii]MBT0337460.1 DNA transfer protein [Morganella morganii subsp. morganii]